MNRNLMLLTQRIYSYNTKRKNCIFAMKLLKFFTAFHSKVVLLLEVES